MGRKVRVQKALQTRGIHLTHKIFKFMVSEMPFPAFSAEYFHYINTRENAVVICSFYPSLVFIGNVQCLQKK